jgi:hypothetical protein
VGFNTFRISFFDNLGQETGLFKIIGRF